MLTVLAITAVLLTIIVYPIIQSFDLTRAGAAFADAQDEARALTSKIADEIGNAYSVRPTSNLIATAWYPNGVVNPSVNASLPNSSMVIQVPGLNGQTVEEALLYTKLDLIPPAQGQYPTNGQNGGIQAGGAYGAGGFSNPVVGKVDPTLKAPTGQFGAPVTPSLTMVRYFVALRNPILPYHNPYNALLAVQNGGRDNLFVLYRSVVAPYVAYNGALVPNTALFGTTGTSPNVNVTLDDPRLMALDYTNAGAVAQDPHNVRLYHWLGQMAPWETNADPVADNPANFAHTVVQTQDTRYDMIAPQYDIQNQKVYYDGNIPRITPCVQFRPTVVSNDPTAGQEAVRQGEESDNALLIAPDVYKTEYGLWNTNIVRTFPEGYTPGSAYLIGYPAQTGAPGFSVYYYNPAGGQSEFTGGTEMFDDYDYSMSVVNGVTNSFTVGALDANSRSGWLSEPVCLSTFTPYNILSGPGKVVTSFDISEVGTGMALPSDAYEDPNRPDLPTIWNSIGPYDAGSTSTDPNFTSGTWTGNFPWSPLGPTSNLYQNLWTPTNNASNPYDINEAFNQAYDEFPDQDGNVQRFLDLRVIPQEDGTYSPLFPSYNGATTSSYYGAVAASPDAVTGFLSVPGSTNRATISKCRIVPGSEVVYGPDQIQGPNQGHPIRYTRTTHPNPGPDQYRINYVDQTEPTDINGNVTAAAYTARYNLTPTELGSFDPGNYDPTNFVSAVLQPQYKAGYIAFDSDPDLPIPTGYTPTGGSFIPVPIKVDFRFQFTGTVPNSLLASGAGASDVFAVDYDTRQLMQVLLTIRNYPQSTVPNPQSVTLKATAAIRNYAH